MQTLALLQQWLPDLPAPVASELAGLLLPFAVSAGTRLFRQDDPGDGVWLLAAGCIRVESRTPGDGLVVITRLGPGTVLGETALLDGGNRSAAAVAETATHGFRLDATAFHALKAARRPAALAVQARLQAIMAERLVGQLQALAGAEAAAAALPPPAPDAPLDAPALLGRFPGFTGWAAAEWQEFAGLAVPFAAPRGAVLAGPGQVPPLFCVARGALLLHGGGEQLLVDGPGALAPVGPALAGQPLPARLCVAERCTGWWWPPAALAGVLASGSPLALRLRDVLDLQLARDLRRLSRVRGRRAAMRNEREAG